MGVRSSATLLASVLSFAVGCPEDRDDPPSRRDAATDVDSGSADAGDPISCHDVDETCPDRRPVNGSTCAGDLSCDFMEAGGQTTWTHRCESGQWTSNCMSSVPGGCAYIPLSETCDRASEGPMPGATMAVGAVSATNAFRAFEAQEMLTIEWGAQGLPMLPFRVQVTAASEPSCVTVVTKMTLGAREGGDAQTSTRLRCGESSKILSIIPFDVYDRRVFDMQVEVTVKGVGTSTAAIRFMGGPP